MVVVFPCLQQAVLAGQIGLVQGVRVAGVQVVEEAGLALRRAEARANLVRELILVSLALGEPAQSVVQCACERNGFRVAN